MGLTHVEGTLTGPSGEQRTLRFLVDSGASYTLVPTPVWQELGITPIRAVDLVLADGTVITRQVSAGSSSSRATGRRRSSSVRKGTRLRWAASRWPSSGWC